ncbi:MAG: signal peptidase I [Candidatus Saccharimonadales bacterium]
MTPNEKPVVMGPLPQQNPVPVEPNEPRKEPKREGIASIVSTVAVLLIAPIVALFLTAFVFQSYQVDGPSMETTLYNNDRLIVWKVPKTWSRITGHPYIPNRGDVVIFVEREIDGFDSGQGKQLIKRVIGLPGERVVVKDNVATVYNQEHPEGFQPDKTLPYGNVIQDTTINTDVTVPKDQIFVMGDNRSNSLDSRTFGPVAAKDIVGKLIVRVWPINSVKNF